MPLPTFTLPILDIYFIDPQDSLLSKYNDKQKTFMSTRLVISKSVADCFLID